MVAFRAFPFHACEAEITASTIFKQLSKYYGNTSVAILAQVVFNRLDR